jgi:hypothetical protein
LSISREVFMEIDTPNLGQLLAMAIDPMALFLPGAAYLRWGELHHPHVPTVAEMREGFACLSAEQKKVVLQRATVMAEYSAAIQEALKAY